MNESYCPVCSGTESLPEPAIGTCARCFNHMLLTEDQKAEVKEPDK